jgi:hypothetical protein
MLQHQHQFDEENHLIHLLVGEHTKLLAAVELQRVFGCGVCLDTLPEESIASIDPCGHSFCRECIREFIMSQIESRRFPVLCLTCTAGPGDYRPESTGSYVSIIRYLSELRQAD